MCWSVQLTALASSTFSCLCSFLAYPGCLDTQGWLFAAAEPLTNCSRYLVLVGWVEEARAHCSPEKMPCRGLAYT